MTLEIPSLLISCAFLFVTVIYYTKGENFVQRIADALRIARDNLSENIGYGIAGFALVLLLLSAVVFLAGIFGIDDYTKTRFPYNSSSLLVLGGTIAIAPIAEELFFRGMLLEKFGFLISSAGFAFVHFGYGSWVQIIAAFVIGLVFCWLAISRKSLIPSITAHFAYNLIFVAGA